MNMNWLQRGEMTVLAGVGRFVATRALRDQMTVLTDADPGLYSWR